MLDPELVAYYTRQSGDYEKIFQRDDPERQREQRQLTAAMRTVLAGRDVLEVACGTAYWTERIVDAVASITALDSSPGMLDCARQKKCWSDQARLVQGDAFSLSSIPGQFNGVLANFWISHVPQDRLPEFLRQLQARLAPASVVFFADNMLVPGLGGDLITRPGSKDTYKRRTFPDGTTHDVLKNYYSRDQLHALFASHAEALEITVGSCFWWVSYRTR